MEESIKKPIQTFREGAVGASVWLRQSLKGPFYELTFSRSYKNERTGASGYSMAFPDRHIGALTQVIARAQAWVNTQRLVEMAASESISVLGE